MSSIIGTIITMLGALLFCRCVMVLVLFDTNSGLLSVFSIILVTIGIFMIQRNQSGEIAGDG